MFETPKMEYRSIRDGAAIVRFKLANLVGEYQQFRGVPKSVVSNIANHYGVAHTEKNVRQFIKTVLYTTHSNRS